MDYRIFNMRTDSNACDCTRGCTDTVRESAIKIDSWRKVPYHMRVCMFVCVCDYIFYIYIFYTTVLSQWDFSHGKFGCPWKSQLRQSRAT